MSEILSQNAAQIKLDVSTKGVYTWEIKHLIDTSKSVAQNVDVLRAYDEELKKRFGDPAAQGLIIKKPKEED